MNEPTTITIGADTYQIGRLDAKKQFHVGRRLMPVQTALAAAAAAAAKAREASVEAWLAAFMGPVGKVVATMPEEDVNYILDTCLAVVKRQQGERFAPVQTNGMLMFTDIDMQTMLKLTIEVVKENLGSFFGMDLGGSV